MVTGKAPADLYFLSRLCRGVPHPESATLRYHIRIRQTSPAAAQYLTRRSRTCRPAKQRSYLRPDDPQPSYQPNDPNTLQPSQVEKRHHQLAPSVGTIVPLQIKLITQLLMVSTRNTSRSNANPPRMQDPPGDIDNRLPDTI